MSEEYVFNVDESDEHRYLFTVRQQFGKTPAIDSFYELTVPPGITGDQAQVMIKLNATWCKNEMEKDTSALKGMQMRLRFNSDIYQHVCLVRTESSITAEDLDSIVAMKHDEGKLIEFLDKSAV